MHWQKILITLFKKIRFAKNNININGNRVKFTYSAIMETLFVDKTIPNTVGYSNGKFSSISKIRALRTASERYYENNNNTLLGINNEILQLYQTAITVKKNNVCLYLGHNRQICQFVSHCVK